MKMKEGDLEGSSLQSKATSFNTRAVQAGMVLGSGWVVAMTVCYVWTAVGSVRVLSERIPLGDRRLWFLMAAAGAALLVLAGLVVLQFLFRRLPIFSSLPFLLAILGLSFVILSRQSRAFGVAVWILALAYASGDYLLRLGGAKTAGKPGEWSTVSFSLGLALLSLLGFALGLSGLLSRTAILASFIVLTAVQFKSFRQLAGNAARAIKERRDSRGAAVPALTSRLIWLLLALVALYNLAWALAPELRFDALHYQLAVPRIYLENERIVDLPYFWHSYFARLVNMIFVLAMALGGQIAAKLIVFATGLIATFGVFALGCSLLSRRAGLWAAAIFYSTPIVSWLSTTAYVDLTLAMFTVACWIALLRWRESAKVVWIWASGALAGAVVGTKLTGVLGLPVIVLMTLVVARRARPLTSRLREVAGFALAALIVGLPWYLLTWWFTGNPFFPMLNGVFKSPYWAQVNEMFKPDYFGLGRTVTSLYRLPFALTFESRRFDEVLPSGGVGIALVLLPLGIGLLFRGRERTRLIFLGCLVFVVLWGLSFQYARFYTPILPLVAALATAGAVHWAASGWPRRLNLTMLWIAFLAQGALIPISFDGIVIRNPLALVTGTLNHEEYLSRSLGGYRAVDYLNRVTVSGDRVLGHDLEALRYYIKAPLESFLETRGLAQSVEGQTAEQMASNLDQLGYGFIAINRLGDPHRPAALQAPFLDRFAILEYSFGYTDVYRLKLDGAGLKNQATTNLLANSGLEQSSSVDKPDGWIGSGEFEVTAEESFAHSGLVSVCLSRDGVLSQRVAVEPDRLYSLSQYTRAEGAGRVVRLQVNWLDSAGRRIDVSIELVPLRAEWTWQKMQISAPFGAALAEVSLSSHDQQPVCFDDVSFSSGVQLAPQI